MPGMDKEDAPKKGIDLAIIMGGKPKGDAGKMGAEKPKESDSDDLPPGFEEAFAEAFPDAAGDHERMLALKRLIGTCMSGDDY